MKNDTHEEREMLKRYSLAQQISHGPSINMNEYH